MRKFVVVLFVVLFATFANAGVIDMCTDFAVTQVEPTVGIQNMTFGG